MKIHIALVFSVLGVVIASSTASAQVQLTMQGGHVTLSARNATIRQILAEWERVGETKIVNGERSPGGLVTLELPNMPEQQALDIILRSASGALFAPRTEAAAGNVSAYAQIILMPPSVAPPPASAATPASPPFGQQTVYPQQMPLQQPPAFQQPGFPQPGFQQPGFQQQQLQQPLQFQPPPPASDDDDQPTVAQPRPVFVFPQPHVTNPQGSPAGGATPQPQSPPAMVPQGMATSPPSAAFPGAPTSATPGGVSIPGMMVPAPVPQPGQPGYVPPPQPAPQRTAP